jgi:hypothetical protein
MIELPRRSVTRFFIPLIDVLTLLFCIFLLMPVVKPEPGARTGSDGAGEAPKAPSDPEELARRLRDVEKELEHLRRERNYLRQERVESLQHRLDVQVLMMGDKGQLYHYTPAGPEEIRTEADAQRLIAQRRKEAEAHKRELLFVILYPQKSTGYPEPYQEEQYARWFKEVAHKFENPRGGR